MGYNEKNSFIQVILSLPYSTYQKSNILQVANILLLLAMSLKGSTFVTICTELQYNLQEQKERKVEKKALSN